MPRHPRRAERHGAPEAGPCRLCPGLQRIARRHQPPHLVEAQRVGCAWRLIAAVSAVRRVERCRRAGRGIRRRQGRRLPPVPRTTPFVRRQPFERDRAAGMRGGRWRCRSRRPGRTRRRRRTGSRRSTSRSRCRPRRGSVRRLAASSVTIASVWCAPNARRYARSRRRRPSTSCDRQDRVEIFGVPVTRASAASRCAARARGSRRRRAARSRPRPARPAIARRLGEGAVDQHRLGRAADAGAAHLGVDAPARRAFAGSAARVDIGVVDPVEMGEHGHARLGLHARDQALAAARDDHVDQPLRREHRADGRAVA